MDRLGHTRILTAFTTSLLGIAALVLLTGCDKRALFFDYDTDDSVARAELKISLDVDGGAMVGDVETKSVVTGTTLNQVGRTYGIIACEHEDTPSQYKIYDADNAGLYGNIKASYYYLFGSYGWNYSYEPSSTSYFRPLYFVTNNPSRHMDIYAYAPWKSGVSIESGYRYDLTNLNNEVVPDLMYATYDDAEGYPTNKDIELVDGTTIPIKILFHHALSRIAFHFRLADSQNSGIDGQHALRLYMINLFRADTSSTPLHTMGTMDLLTGNVASEGFSQSKQTSSYANSQNVGEGLSIYDIYKSDAWTTFDMLVNPVNYLYSGDFFFQFMFNGSSSAQAMAYQYIIEKEDLKHPNPDPDSIPDIYGFRPGYCYHFYFIIDNYIHLQNVVIDTDWEPTDEKEIKI